MIRKCKGYYLFLCIILSFSMGLLLGLSMFSPAEAEDFAPFATSKSIFNIMVYDTQHTEYVMVQKTPNGEYLLTKGSDPGTDYFICEPQDVIQVADDQIGMYGYCVFKLEIFSDVAVAPNPPLNYEMYRVYPSGVDEETGASAPVVKDITPDYNSYLPPSLLYDVTLDTQPPMYPYPPYVPPQSIGYLAPLPPYLLRNGASTYSQPTVSAYPSMYAPLATGTGIYSTPPPYLLRNDASAYSQPAVSAYPFMLTPQETGIYSPLFLAQPSDTLRALMNIFFL
jgi:hypothetical protein